MNNSHESSISKMLDKIEEQSFFDEKAQHMSSFDKSHNQVLGDQEFSQKQALISGKLSGYSKDSKAFLPTSEDEKQSIDKQMDFCK